MDSAPAFLNVTNSLSGRRWSGPDPARGRLAEQLCQSAGVPRMLANVLARNKILPDEVVAYLNPRLRELMPDPLVLKDMETAALRLNDAIARGQRIAIFADYDVDGGASAALLIRWLRAIGAGATHYVPDRLREGFGPNVPAMQALSKDNDLIVCVDCGTLSHEAIGAATGADVIVVDHHLGGATLPPALAVVNPNRQDEGGELTTLCAAGVVFMLLVEANRQRRSHGGATPDLLSMLDLVALATVADVAPLTGLNRAFVKQGLAVMGRRERPGVVALLDQARISAAPAAHHLGFVLGPRINAGGRLGDSDLGLRLLATDDPAEAARLAEVLDRLNAERRAIETNVRDEALAQIDARTPDGTQGQSLAWAAGPDWHPGVLGIVASRVKEAMSLPSIVMGIDGDSVKGSGRSVPGIDLGTAIQRLADEGLIQQGGGHAMAAGLSLSKTQIRPAMERLKELLMRQGGDELGQSELAADGLLMATAATPEIIEHVETAGPFGSGNPQPIFVLPDQIIRHCRYVGEHHLKISFSESGGDSQAMDGILFNARGTTLGQALEEGRGATFHLAGHLEINHWQGRKQVQLRLVDAARSDS